MSPENGSRDADPNRLPRIAAVSAILLLAMAARVFYANGLPMQFGRSMASASRPPDLTRSRLPSTCLCTDPVTSTRWASSI